MSDDLSCEMRELRERLVKAADVLDNEAGCADVEEFHRLRSKRLGILLAIDYIRAYQKRDEDDE